jgi:hypothetical protein
MSTEEQMMPKQPGRGELILIFGILSIVLLGPILGIPTWVMGKQDLKKIQEGIIHESARSSTKIGMILGIIGTFWILAVILIGAIIAVVLSLAASQY